MQGKWAYITFAEDYDRPSFGGRPIDPGWGVGGGEHPSHGLPGFPGAPGHPGHLPSYGRPTDPGYGVDEGAEAGQLPVWPLDPDKPEHGLPPTPGHPLPPLDPPPGTIWPPLPPSVPPGKALVLVAISGVGYRYVVVTIPEHETDPDYGVDEGEGPEVQPPQPGQPLPVPPGRPPSAGQPLPRPPVAGRPPQPGQPLPPTGRPPAPGQGLPVTPPGRPGTLPGRR